MLEIVKTLFFTLVALGVLVTIHEFGHFWVARRCGIKVLRFSIGFGTPFARWYDRKGTEFVLAVLPLGGYVKMVDEREGNVDPQDIPYAFNNKSVWQRMAVVSAGPIANFLLAVIAYWVVFMAGVQGVAPIVDRVVPGSIADRAGIEPGQEILAVDGEPTPTLQTLGEQLVLRLGEEGTINFRVKYQDSNLSYDLEAELNGWQVDTDNPDPIGDIGIELYTPKVLPVADQVMDAEPAAEAGLRSGDRITAMDGIEVSDWAQWVEYVRARPGETIAIEVARGSEKFATQITPKGVTQDDGSVIGQVGMSVVIPEWPESYLRKTDYGVVGAFGQALHQTWKTTKMVLDSIKKMVTGIISPKHLSGPITIAKVAGASAQYGFTAYLGFLALLSVSLGVLNLLPIPVLDGGHLMYYMVEAVKGSPVSEKIQMAGYRLGLFLVVGLMVIALYNDVMRL
ncbi:MAG: sigma E protease regulator RseP [Porticoccaceae bacterium]|nr:sigma E protease regulator RseP [Porticoccaceae bacterium]